MRIDSVLVLCVSSVALAACAGGGGGGLLASGTASQNLEVCGINCVPPVDTSGGTGGGTTGGGTTGGGTGTGTGGGVGTGGGNTGNSTRLSTGDTTIILETSRLKNPLATPGLSRLTVATAPNTARIQIDTTLSDADNAKWPLAKTMAEYSFGTNYDDPDVATRNLGGAYKEYRALSYNTDGSSADEVLQVWNWTNSYATQYRDLTSGGEAGHQAWSFGGTRTAATAMPTSTTVNYAGRYTSTSKTWNMSEQNLGQTIAINNLWRVQGAANATADFGTGNFTATLTPETWNAYQTLNGATGFLSVTAGNVADINHKYFMNDNINLKGTITTSATTGNAINGTAEMDPTLGWVTNQSVNPMYAAFFGPAADEVTGAFNLEAVDPFPVGGDISINDDRRGFIQQSGIFNVQ